MYICILGIREQILYTQNFTDNVNDFLCVFKILTAILTIFYDNFSTTNINLSSREVRN